MAAAKNTRSARTARGVKRVLLDNNLDHRFARLLPGHEVVHARLMGWKDFRNGDLITAAEREEFDALITGDKNLRYQQNLADRQISIITLNSRLITLLDIAPLAPRVLEALEVLSHGAFVVIDEA